MNGLTLLGEVDAPSHPKYGKLRRWRCAYCPNEFEAYNWQAKSSSKRGGLGHCGCQTKIRQSEKNAGRSPVNKLDDLTASANKVWNVSTKKGRTITKDEVKLLISQDCHYCGAAPDHYRTVGSGEWARKSTVPTHGIDRKDSDKGYDLDNCVTCCTRCNLMKREIPYQEFIDLCKMIASRF